MRKTKVMETYRSLWIALEPHHVSEIEKQDCENTVLQYLSRLCQSNQDQWPSLFAQYESKWGFYLLEDCLTKEKKGFPTFPVFKEGTLLQFQKAYTEAYRYVKNHCDIFTWQEESSYFEAPILVQGLLDIQERNGKGLSIYQAAEKHFYPAWAKKLESCKSEKEIVDALKEICEKGAYFAISKTILWQICAGMGNRKDSQKEADLAPRIASYCVSSSPEELQEKVRQALHTIPEVPDSFWQY